ncbi:MAG: hypothetical protein WBD83_10920 [Xanthobacteraceae bacterium]|jgi:hypothetical protein
MTDTVTFDVVPALKDGGTLDELSKQIEPATDWGAVERNQKLIDSFIQENWREPALRTDARSASHFHFLSADD